MGIFDTTDDYMFPTTRQGRAQAGIFESAADTKNGEAEDDSVSDAFRNMARARAMSALLLWVDEGEYTYAALDELVIIVADIDGDFDISEEEEAQYNASGRKWVMPCFRLART